MAALAYLLLPVSGLAAYLKGTSARVRFHGLQAIALGVVWPAALYACTYLSPGVTQLCAAVGAVIWIGLLVTTALGLNPRLPVAGRYLQRAASEDPRALRDAPARAEE